MKSFPLYKQLDAMDCGPTCLRMVATYYGRFISLDHLRNKSQYGKQGVSIPGLANVAEIIRPKREVCRLKVEKVNEREPINSNRYVVSARKPLNHLQLRITEGK